MSRAICKECEGEGFIYYREPSTYADSYRSTCERCYGSGDIEVPISARGHLKESWLMERKDLVRSIGIAAPDLPNSFIRRHLRIWMRNEGRQIHADYVHDFL